MKILKTRRNVTLNPHVIARATEVMQLRHFDDFSGFIEQLIREEWERRNGPAQFAGAPSSSKLSSAPTPIAVAGTEAEQAASDLIKRSREGGGPPKP